MHHVFLIIKYVLAIVLKYYKLLDCKKKTYENANLSNNKHEYKLMSCICNLKFYLKKLK